MIIVVILSLLRTDVWTLASQWVRRPGRTSTTDATHARPAGPVRCGAWTRCTCSSIQAEKGPVKAHFAQRRYFPSSGLAEKPASITRPTGKNYSWKLCPISPFFIKHKEIVLPACSWLVREVYPLF